MDEVEMKEKTVITTDNIFADIGLKNSEELRARSDLLSEVVHIIRKSQLSQQEIAKILGISPPKVSALMTGKINDFSNDTLVHYLTLLGYNVEIKVVRCRSRRLSRTTRKGTLVVKRSSLRRKHRVKIY
jgi:predicted XRE-type DNA-binding protein